MLRLPLTKIALSVNSTVNLKQFTLSQLKKFFYSQSLLSRRPRNRHLKAHYEELKTSDSISPWPRAAISLRNRGFANNVCDGELSLKESAKV